MTILKRQGQSTEHILSFDVTDPTFEKEILSELIAYEEEDDQEEDVGVEEEAMPAFQPYDNDPEGPNLHVEEETKVINIGTAEEVREVRISARLTPQARAEFIAFLMEYADVFAWSYDDMVGLDVKIVVHNLPLKPDAKPIKQELRIWRPQCLLMLKEEIVKQHNVNFLKVVLYLEWLANVVPVPKKDGRVRMCIDYKDLNKASPKDDFPCHTLMS